MLILVVEDDAKVSSAVRTGLSEAGYGTDLAFTKKEALHKLDQTRYDLVLLDLGLPDGDGLDILQHLQAPETKFPVLVLTARDRLEDRVKGLDLGADDYLVKPFAFSELLARIRALLRRSSKGDALLLKIGELEVDLVSREARRRGKVLDLRPKEFDLLVFLARHAGHPVSRETLSREVWKVESPAVPMDNVIDVHVSHLRGKLDDDLDEKMLITVRGVGFKLEDPTA